MITINVSELFQELHQKLKPDDKEFKKYLMSPEGNQYILRLIQQGHPLGLFFFSKQLNDPSGQPYVIQKGALQAEIYESGYPDPLPIKDSEGNVLFSVQPGDKWIQVHVIGNAEKYLEMEPREKIEAFQNDLQSLIAYLRTKEGSDPQQSISYDTAIIGISHLVRLFTVGKKRMKRQMIWSTDDAQIMPKEVSSFFANMSSGVSQNFGGGTVKEDAVRVLCTTARDLDAIL